MHKTMLAAAITGILSGSVLNNAFDEQTPPFILSISSSARTDSACRVGREQAPLHLERKEVDPDLKTDGAFDGDPFQASAFQTAAPQFFQDVQPAFFPARPSNLVTVLTSYPLKAAQLDDMPHSHGEPQLYEPVFGAAATAQSQSSGPVTPETGALTLTAIS